MALKHLVLMFQTIALSAMMTLAARGAVIDVPPGGAHLAAALERAASGDTLRLLPGVHQGPVTIGTPLTLRGMESARVTGNKSGSVITVTGPDVKILSLVITGSGSRNQDIDAGIKLVKGADRAVVDGNRLIGNLVGIDIHGAVDARVLNNEIEGRTDHRMNDRGNGVYVWNAPGAVVEGNHIRHGRDGIFVNTSRNNVFRNNRMEDLRFAIHYMYANDSAVLGNVSVGNHMGFALMFSRGLVVRGNVSLGDREHGLMLNYANDSLIENNIVRAGKNKCLFVYNANKNILRSNLFERCAIGIHFTAGSERNRIYDNAFISNRIQVKYVGTRDLDWSFEGTGNYWSDHAAFDINGDGIADQPYRPNDAIDKLLWRQPSAELLLGSPAVQLVRWAQSAFPSLLPGGIIDTAPLMTPPDLSAVDALANGAWVR